MNESDLVKAISRPFKCCFLYLICLALIIYQIEMARVDNLANLKVSCLRPKFRLLLNYMNYIKLNHQKGATQTLIIGVIALIIIVGGAIYLSSVNRPEEPAMMDKKDSMMDKNETMMEDQTMGGDSMMTRYAGQVLAGTQALLLDFNKADYDAAFETDKLIALYFYANWCPICKAEFPKMQAAFNELTTDKVIGFRVNYNDNETDNDEKALAREFGVAYQHTKVFLKNGARVLKSPESWNQERYLTEITRFLSQ